MNKAQTEAIANAEAHLNNAGLALSIYTVYNFRPNGDSTYKVCVHYVAGYSSEDAERRIKAGHAGHLVSGPSYISTDDLRERDPYADCKLYITGWREELSVTIKSMAEWRDRMTREDWHDGQRTPPAFRRFHVEGAKANAAAEECEIPY